MLSVRYGERRRGGLNTRWATEGDGLAIVAYVGPVRALDAAVLGDSVYVALRPSTLVQGPIPREEGLGPRGLRFLTRPWDFGAPWVRDAIERARIEPYGGGWRLSGSLSGSEGKYPFQLELDRKSQPKRLTILGRGSSQAAPLASVRYGPVRRFDLGRLPRWIEWKRGTTLLRLEIDEHARAKRSHLVRAPSAGREWTILALDDPRGRDMLRRLLGIGEEPAR
jgi:hypothetical protein